LSIAGHLLTIRIFGDRIRAHSAEATGSPIGNTLDYKYITSLSETSGMYSYLTLWQEAPKRR